MRSSASTASGHMARLVPDVGQLGALLVRCVTSKRLGVEASGEREAGDAAADDADR